MEIKDILKSFERYDKKYKQQEVDAACARREEIIPHLLALLEQVQRDPRTYIADDNFCFDETGKTPLKLWQLKR